MVQKTVYNANQVTNENTNLSSTNFGIRGTTINQWNEIFILYSWTGLLIVHGRHHRNSKVLHVGIFLVTIVLLTSVVNGWQRRKWIFRNNVLFLCTIITIRRSPMPKCISNIEFCMQFILTKQIRFHAMIYRSSYIFKIQRMMTVSTIGTVWSWVHTLITDTSGIISYSSLCFDLYIV